MEYPPGNGVSLIVLEDETEEPSEDYEITGQRLVESMAPGSPDREGMTQWISSVESRLQATQNALGSGRGGGGGGDRPPPSEPPIPKHLRKTQQMLDFVKYMLILVLGLVGAGFFGHEYISQFQTESAAVHAQQQNTVAHGQLMESIDTNGSAIDDLRVFSVRIELEQRSTNDRLDQLLALEQAAGGSSRDRVEAQARVEALRRRINHRDRIIRNPAALEHAARRVAQDPLSGVDVDDL